MDMKSGTLPLTSPRSGYYAKNTVPVFFASTDGLRLPSFISIQLRSLWLWFSTVLLFEGFLPIPSGSDSPLSCLFSFVRLHYLISTVLLFADFLLILKGSDCLLSCLFSIGALPLIILQFCNYEGEASESVPQI